MSVPCTKEVILTLIEDIELIAKELVENAVAPKQKRLSSQEHKAVTELLVSKDKELKEALKVAAEQREVEREREDKLCCICHNQDKCMMMLPCRHLCICAG